MRKTQNRLDKPQCTIVDLVVVELMEFDPSYIGDSAMRGHYVRSVVTVAFVLTIMGLQNQVRSGDAVAPQERIQNLIEQLDSDKYANREAATLALVEMGGTAIQAVTEAAASDSPEVAWRAGSILEQIGLSGDETTLRDVIQAMQRLQKNENSKPFGKRAAGLVTRWQTVRHERAAARLHKLGATVQNSPAGWMIDVGGGGGGFVLGGVGDVLLDEIVLDAADFDLAEDGIAKEEVEAAKVDPAKDAKEADGEEVVTVRKVPADDAPVFEPIVIKDPAEDPAPVVPADPDKKEDEGPAEDEPAEIVVELADGVDFDFEVVGADIAVGGPIFLGGDVLWGSSGEVQTTRSVTIGKGWKGTDKDLRLLAEINKLSVLTIDKTHLSDEGFRQLARIKGLSRLSLNYASFNRAAVLEFKRLRPDVTLYATGETLLGVSGEAHADGFLVSHVVPGSGASKAGIRMGDVLVSADGVKLKSLDELTLAIAHKKVEDKLAVTYMRGGKQHSTVAILGPRDAPAPQIDFGSIELTPLRDP